MDQERRPGSRIPMGRGYVLGQGILALAVGGSVLAVGAVHTPVLLVVAMVVFVAFALVVLPLRPLELTASALVLLATGVGLVAYTSLQLVPLPMALLAKIAPTNADIWARAPEGFGLPALTEAPISLDPGATRVEVLRGLVYLLVFLVAFLGGKTRQRRLVLEAILVGSALMLGAASVLHGSFGAEKVFGLYRPVDVRGTIFSPLLNPNHLGGYLNMGASIALGLALSSRPFAVRGPAFASWIVLVALSLYSGSRGAVACLSVSGVLVILGRTFAVRRNEKATSRHEKRGMPEGLRSMVLAALVGFAGLAMGVLSASEAAREQLSDHDLSKFDVVRQVMKAGVRHFAWFGSGRGSFESAFQAYRSSGGHYVFTHPENFVAQWFFEWGIPVSVVAFASIVWALRPATALAHRGRALGPWAAIVALGLQNCVDFSSEVPGVVLALCACAGLVAAADPSGSRVASTSSSTRSSSSGHAPAPKRLGAAPLFALFAAAIAAFCVVVFREGRAVVLDRLDAKELTSAPTLDASRVRAHLEAAALRHPAEPYLPYAAAVARVRTGVGDPLPLLQRTLELAPVYPPAHRLLAVALWSRVPSQARLEYRYAAEQDPQYATSTATEGAPLVASLQDAMELVPRGEGARGALTVLSNLLADRLPATSALLQDELLRQGASPEEVTRVRLRRVLSDLAAVPRAPWCDPNNDRCVQEGLELADNLVRLAPQRCESHRMRAEVLRALGSEESALQYLWTAMRLTDDRAACLKSFVALALNAGQGPLATQAIEALLSGGCNEPADCVHNLEWAADVVSSQGNRALALVLIRRASERAPDRIDLLEGVATRAAALGLHAEAIEHFRTLSQRRPDEPRYARALAQEETALKNAAFARTQRPVLAP